MYAPSEIASLAETLPVDLLMRIARVNAKFDALCDVESSLGQSKTIDMMQDDLIHEFETLFAEALALMPADVREEEPYDGQEWPNQESLQRHLQRL